MSFNSLADVFPHLNPEYPPPLVTTNGHSKSHAPTLTVPRLAPQTFVHPDNGHWLKVPEGFERMLFQAPLSVTQVVYLVLKRTMQSTASFPPNEAYYVTLSYAYFMRGGRMSRMSVMRGLQEAVERGYLVRRRVGKQQWEYAIAWKGVQNCTDGHQYQK